MSDLKLATSAIPSVLIAAFLPTSDTTQYTCPAATTTRIASCTITNTTGSSATVTLSVVKSGGSSGASNRVLAAMTLTANQELSLGELCWLSPGDFISAFSNTGSAVSIVMTGIAFSIGGGGSSGGLTGLQFEGVGTGGRVTSQTNTATVSWTQLVGSNANRYMASAFCVDHASSSAWSLATVLSVSSSIDGLHTRLVSIDLGSPGAIGSVHLFGRANPTAGTHTMTATYTLSGLSMSQMIAASCSYYNVAGTQNPNSVYLNSGGTALAITSAAGDVPICAMALQTNPPADLDASLRFFNGGGGNACNYLAFMDAAGAASVNFTSSSSQTRAGVVGIDMIHT